RIFDHRDLVAKLGSIANGRLDAGMRDKPDDDELVYAVLLELQIQVGIGKAAGTPMLCRDDVARLRLELGTNLAAPRAVFERLAGPASFLDRRNIFPAFIIARTIATMHRVESSELRLPRRLQNLQHVRNAVVRLSDAFDAIP